MKTMEAKLDTIMHRMDKQKRKMHTAHEVGAVERAAMRISAEVPTEEDSYGVEEAKYVNDQEVTISSQILTCPHTTIQH